jgi:type I restriction enzyme S subunit
MNRYNSYKDSGVEWIGEIPKHWDCVRLGMIGTFSSSGIDKKSNASEVPVRMVNYTDIIQKRKYNSIQDGTKEYMQITTPKTKFEEHRLKKGDMVFIPSSETIDDLGYSSLIDFDDEDVVYSYHIIRFQNKREIYHYFKKYLINHSLVLSQFSKESKGTTRQIIGRNVFNNINVVLPPIQEQELIVAYLDKKTAIVDTLIASKEQKINILKEKRTALINHVITKGLDPKVKLKDSGVEWIGEIPEHWVMKKMKYIFQIQKRISGELGYDVLSITQKGIKIKDIESGKGQVSMDYTKYQIVEIGDFAMNHMDLLTGFIDISPYKGVTSPDYRVFSKIDKKINSNFYLSLFQFGYTNKVFYGFGQGSSMFGRWRLPSLEFNNFKLPYPSLEEQNQIVKYLDNQFQEIDETISLEQKKIETLKEYRQALISEVVTGKIKVVKD